MPEVLKRVGRFDLLEVIGRGGAAVVYLAMQRDLQRHVALKELAPYHLADSSFAERFVEESRMAGAMNHANVVTVHEYFEDGSVPYIAMEYLPNGSLRQYIGEISMAQIAGVLEGVLAGLAHGEAHGIVHRDLKPENLLVAADGRVKIADFGVARAYSKAATRAVVTVAGTTIGTPAYMSPEQALGGDLTPATDLYSLGVVAWELLAGQVPFEESDTPVAVLYRHVHEQIPSVRTVAPDVDEGIAVWLEKMLAKRPEDRFQSADAAWMELEDVILELLGPRWRREARLATEDASPRARRTLTPAPFETADRPPDVPSPPEAERPRRRRSKRGAQATPIPQTMSGPAADEPQPTIAPRKRRERSNTTMLRMARRHREGPDEETATSPDTLRRRLVVLGILVAMAAAAVAGVLIASPGSSTPKGPSKAQLRRQAAAREAADQKLQTEEAADRQMTTIVTKLAKSRITALAELANARSAAAQTKDAAAVEKAYVDAAGNVAPLSAKSPAAGRLATSLRTTAGAYARLAAAGHSDNQKAWSREVAVVKRDERQLQGQLAKL
jgi:serine/threonine protein kinase